jgi:YD repeat-containing protein
MQRSGRVIATDRYGKLLRYGYDANGNRTSLTDAEGQVTRYTYDALNRLSTVLDGGGLTTYAYDRSSLQRQVDYPNGTRSRHGYDQAGRTTELKHTQGAALIAEYTYGYDANGNRTRQTETNGGAEETTTYAYDPNDRLINGVRV